jgi:hypothetical protein
MQALLALERQSRNEQQALLPAGWDDPEKAIYDREENS